MRRAVLYLSVALVLLAVLFVLGRGSQIAPPAVSARAASRVKRSHATTTVTRHATTAVASRTTVDADFLPPVLKDGRDVPGDPLDVREVTFGQRDTQLWLKIRTQGNWTASQLADDGLCVLLVRDQIVGRVCISQGDHAATAVNYRRVAVNGIVGRARTVAAALVREDQRTVFATFSPRAVGLAHGSIRWVVASHWQAPGTCSGGCDDRVPNTGYRAATISALAQPRCFGAAARAGGRPCSNPALRTTVIPNPTDAAFSPDSPCRPYDDPLKTAVLRPCEFGDVDSAGAAQAALIGDSHAGTWRGAVDVVAQARGWRAVSIVRPGCAFSTEAYPARLPVPANCHRLSDEAVGWLRAHPSVHTLFTSSSAGRGLTAAGFLAIWSRVPATVHRIYVMRDVPRVRGSTAACVLSVLHRHERSAGACAVPRGASIVPDTSAQAALQAPSRVRLIDLTRYFCDRTSCFPVVGGAYVYRDDNHMNSVFSTSLGPFLLGALR